jgi:hypothetical protein
MQYSILLNTLKAAHFCSAEKSDVRYYLNSVYLDFKLQADKPYVNVVATDGHLLAAFKDPIPNEGVLVEDFSILIPLDTIKTLIKMTDKKQTFVTLEKVGDSWRIGDLNFEAIDGKFPDYTRVIPGSNDRTSDNGAPRLDPVLVSKAEKALCTRLNHKANYRSIGTMSYGPTKNDSAVLHGGDNTGVIVIMPLRAEDKTYFGFTA